MKKTSRKVVIVGTGFVGTSIAYAMINQGISNELVLIDVNQEKAEGEALDLLDGMAWGDENVAVWSVVMKNVKMQISLLSQLVSTKNLANLV